MLMRVARLVASYVMTLWPRSQRGRCVTVSCADLTSTLSDVIKTLIVGASFVDKRGVCEMFTRFVG